MKSPSAALTLILAWAGMVVAGAGYLRLEAARPQDAAAQAKPRTPAPAEVLDKYCVTCHNWRLKTAGLQLDTLDVDRVGDHAEIGKRSPPSFAPARCRRRDGRGRTRATYARHGGWPSKLRSTRPPRHAESGPRRRPPPEPRRVRQRHPRSARARDRWPRAAVGRRRSRSGRLRQRRERAVGLAGAARELPVGRANASAGLRSAIPRCSSGGRHLQDFQGARAGRAHERRPAVRLAGRRADSLPLSARRASTRSKSCCGVRSTTTSSAWASRTSSTSGSTACG